MQAWDQVCQNMHDENLTDWNQFSSIKDKLTPQAMSDGFLLLTIDSSFLKNWTTKNFLGAIKAALYNIYGREYDVKIDVDDSEDEDFLPVQTTIQQREIQENDPKPTVDTKTEIRQSTLDLNPDKKTLLENKYGKNEPKNESNSYYTGEFNSAHLAPTLTFSNFVIGESNKMAYSMAVQVAESPGSPVLNPLFIYGKSGLGKTHLLRAIQNDVLNTHPNLSVLYVDTNDLVNEYTQAAAQHNRYKDSFYKFRNKYENADVLLIDDIQFLQGKKQTLDNVFQILNTLTINGSQIVLSADRAPKVIDIDERYTSRFLSGGTCDIQPPEIETKVAIIKSFIDEYKAQSPTSNIWIPEDIINFIAEYSGSNIRELKGAVTMIIYKFSFDEEDVDLEDLKTSLLNHFTTTKTNIGVEDIQKVVENYYKISHSDLVGKSRSKNVAYARQIAFYLCRTILDVPFIELGKKFNRDHSTVLYAVNKIEQELLTNRETEEEIEVLKTIIKDL